MSRRFFQFISFSISALFLFACSNKELPYWEDCSTPIDASFRGISAVSDQVCWISGSKGKVLLTLDGGESWIDRSIPNCDSLQFRDIQAFGKDTVLILSAGFPGLIFKTTDGGLVWNKVYENRNPSIFFDAMDFWNSKRGIAFSDAINDKLVIITTKDGGESWNPLPDSILPLVHVNQGGFAASGQCLLTYSDSSAIIGLGGPEATLLISSNYGESWRKTIAPLDFGKPSKGIYAFAFIDDKRGYCVGGDYLGDSLSMNTIAKTENGGASWKLVSDTTVSGKYRSSILYLDENMIICSSRTGTNLLVDDDWYNLQGNYYSLSKGRDGTIWASGANGSVAKLMWP